MNAKKAMRDAYKQRKLIGGVYTITNTVSGKYVLDYAANLAGVQNHFRFASATGSTVDLRLQEDWQALGAHVFTLTILEELEQGPAQSEAEFREDLTTLMSLWQAKLDYSLAY